MTDGLRCKKCLLQRFDGNHIIHLGYLQSLSQRRNCRLCAFVLVQLVRTQASPNSLVFLRPVSESSTTYAIIFDDVESETIEGWISLSFDLPTDGRSQHRSSIKLDPEQIKMWLHECETTHNHSDTTDVASKDLVDLVLIDVRNGMLVDAEPEWAFAALSYVNGRWGSSDFNLDRFTKDDLKAPRVLFSSTVPLPAVLSDAIKLVRDLGIQYLWCDFICIFQDSHAQKQAQIRQMDAIYGKAMLTVIALSAEHGNMRLPGVRKSSRYSICPIVDLGHGQKAVARAPELEVIKSRSEYTLRGWTFQEEVLSRRCLYLTDFQAYFTCPGGYRREDEHPAAESTRLSHSDLFSSFGRGMSSTRPRIEHLFSLYGKLLRRYNGRRLTYDTDVLDAFYGISQILSRQFSTDFIFGLPQSQLHHALLWVPRVMLERRFPTKPEEPNKPKESKTRGELVWQNDSDSKLVDFHAPEEEMHWIMQPPTWSWAAWRGQVGFFTPLEMPFAAVSLIHHFGMLRQSGILPIEASLAQQGTEQHSHQGFAVHASSSHQDDHGDHLRHVTPKSTNLAGGKQDHRKPFWPAPTGSPETLLSLWLRILNYNRPQIPNFEWLYILKNEQPHRKNYSPMPSAIKHFENPAGTDIPVPDLQLFILDFFRTGITLVHGIVRDLLSSPSRRATTVASVFQNLREEEISNALERWQSTSQTSLIKLDSRIPAPAELMQSWTAVNETLALTYNDRPIWPFKSWFADTWKSTSVSYVISRCLSKFLDTHIQSSQVESWVTLAIKCRFDCLENFSLTRQNALSFFTYSAPADGLTASYGQLYKPSLKYSGLMTTRYGVACDLETLQFSKFNGLGGEIKHPVTAVVINRYQYRYIGFHIGPANPESYNGVLFDYEDRIQLLTSFFRTMKDCRLLLLSGVPPSSDPSMSRPEIWNMMLVKLVENGFYERVAVGRFRSGLEFLEWSYNYIRLA